MSSNVLKLNSYTDKALLKATNDYSEFNQNYILSIQISLDGFSFSIVDEERNKVVAIENYAIQEVEEYEDLAAELESLFSKLEVLKRRFNKVLVLFEGEKAALIPFPLFDENAIDEYLSFNHKIAHGEEVLFNKLNNLQACNVFAIPSCIKNLIKDRFINYTICHFSSTLLEGLLVRFKNQEINNQVIVNVRSRYMDVVIFENSKVDFFNTFKYRTVEDFAYYLIYVLEQKSLNPENIDLVLTGEINKGSKYYEIIYKYIRNIRFIERNDFFNYSYIMDEVPSNYYYNLLNASTCEL